MQIIYDHGLCNLLFMWLIESVVNVAISKQWSIKWSSVMIKCSSHVCCSICLQVINRTCIFIYKNGHKADRVISVSFSGLNQTEIPEGLSRVRSIMAEPDYMDGDSDELIKPKKIMNPVKTSRNHQDLHRELLMNQKRWFWRQHSFPHFFLYSSSKHLH